MADYPQNFVYDSVTQQLSWDAVSGAEQYKIYYKLTTSTTWHEETSATNSMPFEVAPGTYDVFGRSTKEGEQGQSGPEVQVEVTPQ